MAWGKEPNKLYLNTLTAVYLEIIGAGSGQADGIIVVDAGVPGKKYQIVVDESGNENTFSTIIEAVNYFYKHGYELVSAYGTAAGMLTQSNYVLKKSI